MARYVLKLCTGQGWLPGAEAEEFADDTAAYAGAIYGIRDLVASEVREGAVVNLAHFIAIFDECGHELRRVPFREAVNVVDRLDELQSY